MQQVKEGIYFGMNEAEYHALPYFSRSFAETVMFDLEEAKYLLDNPKESTAAMDLGTAIHSMFLEPQEFEKRYIKEPKATDPEFKGKKILFTINDITEILKSVGEKISGSKAELIARVKPFIDLNQTIFWDEVKQNFENNIAGKIALTDNDFSILQGIRESYAKRNEIKTIFENGYSEVTIVWQDAETGVMCKCRLDRVRPEAIGEIKSFSIRGKQTKSLYEVMCREIVYNCYNLQFSIYQQALSTIIKKIKCGKAQVFGDVDQDWLKEFLAQSEKQFFILFVRTQAPYQIKAIELERRANGEGSETAYYSVANNMWRVALHKYAKALKSGIWAEKEVETLDDIHVPQIMYQQSNY